MRWLPCSDLRAISVLSACAFAVYINTLHAGFTFDDNFAVISNGDVSDVNKPITALFFDDFWGQNIRSEQSHKSYRPLTILSFRLQRAVGQYLPSGFSKLSAADHDNTRGVNPLPFHIANASLHAIATCLVYWLSLRLIRVRDLQAVVHDIPETQGSSGRDAGAVTSSTASETSNSGARQRRRPHSESVSPTKTSGASKKITSIPTSAAVTQQGEALLAGLLFALHPIHTEAVAGIVGQAELLCAALSVLAFLAYMAAADGRAAERGMKQGADRCHWPLMVAAVAMTWLAALAKEIGITIVGAMVFYDVLLTPAAMLRRPHGQSSRPFKPGRHPRPRWKHLVAPLADRLVLRIVVMGAAVLVYVQGRGWLAGDHLVRIFRKVENPIAYSDSALTRTLSLGYLHAKYASLLVAPIQLSADWSFACIPLVESLSDPRSLFTLALYAWLLWTAFSIRPWRVAIEVGTRLWGDAQSGPDLVAPRDEAAIAHLQRDRVVRWHFLVAYGLLVAPFFPASNVLFYVGTFIGERLLYFPSVGFCILLAGLLSHFAGPALQRGMNVAAGAKASHFPSVKASVALVLAALLLLAYSARTVIRNVDWVDEERLFVAAQKVCWNSAKVQLNSGILERRYQNWDAAIEHFELARAIDPTYCEPGYWIGLSIINQAGDAERGIQELQRAMDCKYVAVEAVTALVTVFQTLQQAAPKGDPRVRSWWAKLLLHPNMARIEEACDLLEQAAAGVLSAPPGSRFPSPQELMEPCHERLIEAPTQGHLAPVRACIEARAKLVAVLRDHPATSDRGKKATYTYILAAQKLGCRRRHTQDRGPSSAHAMVVNLVQSADAEDAWLQAEWGQTLMTEGRVQEAARHLQVAGMLFAKQAQLQLPGEEEEDGNRPFKPRWGISWDASKVQKLGQQQLSQAAIQSLEVALQQYEQPPCPLLHMTCSMRAQHSSLIKSQGAKSEQVQSAQSQLQQCFARLRELGCS